MHELCMLITFPRDNPEYAGELSDDDEDEVTDQRPVAHCLECVEQDNKEICDFASFMIEKSHSMGPIRVAFPSESIGEDEQNPQSDEEERFEVHESILTVTDALNKTPLHVLCEQSVGIDLLRVILTNTRDHNCNPSAPTALDLITAKDARGSTPLHYLAFSRMCPITALRLVMEYCKPTSNDTVEIDPTLCVDDEGDTPLHWALEGYMSPRRMQVLLKHSKASLSIKNSAGKVPFEKFVGNFIDADWKEHDVTAKESWASVQAYLKVLDDHNQDAEGGWSPLHMLAASPIAFPPVFYDIAIYYCKQDMEKLDSEGRLPLHLACARTVQAGSTECDYSFARQLVTVYPHAAHRAEAKSKRLPIHFAVETRKHLTLIAALLRAYPNSLNVKDPMTSLWPFLLSASNNDETVDTSYSLLRADPSIVQLAVSALTSRRGQNAADTTRNLDASELDEQSHRRLRRLRIRESY
jgi:ankyrin repeat protein